MKKLHNDRGETLIEVLASIVIGSLSVALMFGCIMVSTKMDEKAKALDEEHYMSLTVADAQDAAPTPDPTPTPDPNSTSDPDPTPTPDPDSTPDPTSTPAVTIKRVDKSSEEPSATPTAAPSAEVEITIYGDAGMSSYRRATE